MSSLSQVEIVNLALGNLGVRSTIQSMSEDSAEAGFATVFWDSVLETTLAAFPWGFATAYDALALLGSFSTPTEWGYTYRYPSDCVHARYIVSASGRNPNPPIPFRVGYDRSNGRVIFSDEPGAVLCYTYLVTDPGAFDSPFVHALSWALAAHFAIPLTENARLRQECDAIYQRALVQARTAAAKERGQDPDSKSELETARE